MSLDRFDWLSKVSEQAVDPQREIIDPHHHLWDRGGSTYLADELLIDTSSTHRVTHTVFVECVSKYRKDGPAHLRPIGETEFVANEARKTKSRGGATISGIVAYADMSLGHAVSEVLDAHSEAGDGLFRGIRHATAFDDSPEIKIAHTKPSKGQMGEDNFRIAATVLASREYSYDAWLYHPQIPELTALARDTPELTIVLNHLGAPLGIGPYSDQPESVTSTWKASMTELSTCSNVVLKVGGIGMESYFNMGWANQPSPPGSDEVAERWGDSVRWCIDTFGPSRCMFESNFPVDRETLTYSVVWNSFQKMADTYSESEQDDLFAGTARRIYRVQ